MCVCVCVWGGAVSKFGVCVRERNLPIAKKRLACLFNALFVKK